MRLLTFATTALSVGLASAALSVLPASAQEAVPDESWPSTIAVPKDSDGDGVLDVPDVDSALTTASFTQEPIEDLSQRTETVSVVANPDGSFTRTDSAAPVRVKQGDKWFGIDLSLEKKADGSWAPRPPPPTSASTAELQTKQRE